MKEINVKKRYYVAGFFTPTFCRLYRLITAGGAWGLWIRTNPGEPLDVARVPLHLMNLERRRPARVDPGQVEPGMPPEVVHRVQFWRGSGQETDLRDE